MTIRINEMLIFTVSLICEILHKIDKRLLQYKTYLNMIPFNDKKVVIVRNLK